jgi:putative ABC transport system substrate-binding protein
MRRREFIAGLGSAAAWPMVARAQRLKRVGGQVEDADSEARLTAFRQGLEALGWFEGRNVEVVARFGTAGPDRTRIAVAEMLALTPDVMVTGNDASVAALTKESPSTPIVYAFANDQVTMGFAESLARPGGNVTGFTGFEFATATKWLELLREIVPGMTRVAVMMAPISEYPSGADYLRVIEMPLHLGESRRRR